MPPWYREPLGPVIVTFHLYKSASEIGFAVMPLGGLLLSSVSSFVIRRRELMFV